MSWKKLLGEKKIYRHATSRKEIESVRAVIERDFGDAKIPTLSDDRRYATAYNAALQAAKMVILCSGYRLANTVGHHRLTFEVARLGLGAGATRALDFFETARGSEISSIMITRTSLPRRKRMNWCGRLRNLPSLWSAGLPRVIRSWPSER